MKLNTVMGKVISITFKAGDYNPNVQVAHILMDNGFTFTAAPSLDNRIDSEHFPTPYASLANVKVGVSGVLFFGNKNGYRTPAFVGFVPTE